MTQVLMSRRKDGASARDKSASGKRGLRDPSRASPGQAAFDTWVDRGLHAIYDNIVNEPIPDELLRLIESDRPKD